MGEMSVPDDALYGNSAQRAVLNFPISGRAMPNALVLELGLVKFAYAGPRHQPDVARSSAGKETDGRRHAGSRTRSAAHDASVRQGSSPLGCGPHDNSAAQAWLVGLDPIPVLRDYRYRLQSCSKTSNSSTEKSSARRTATLVM
jgi:hypothetical protein